MTRKRIPPKHPVERGVDLIFGNFPSDQGALGQISRKQSLPNAPDRSRAQHRGDARHHNLDTDTGAIRNLLERFANKSFDLVFRNRENFCVDRIIMLNWQHTNQSAARATLSTPTRRFSDCANKHCGKVTASAGKHEEMPNEMAITQPLVREK